MTDPHPQTGEAAGGGARERHPDRRTIRRFLDGVLESSDAAEVEAHLAECEACGALLEAEEPRVGLPSAEEPVAWDERRFRRAVRRTLWRTAADVVLIGLVGLLGVYLLSQFVWHPLVVGRGDRVAEAVQAAADLPMLTQPGVETTQVTSSPGLVYRWIEVETQRRVGSTERWVEDYEAQLGPLGVGQLRPSHLGSRGPSTTAGPAGGEDVRGGRDLSRLPDGVAVAVQLHWDPGDAAGIAEIDELAVGVDDAALEWVGFDVGDPPHTVPPHGVGYGACHSHHHPEQMNIDGWGGFGFDAVPRSFPGDAGGGASVALEETRRALANLEEVDMDVTGRGIGDPAAVAGELEGDPGVRSVVVTGSVEAVEQLIDAAAPEHVSLLDVEFDVGPTEPCG